MLRQRGEAGREHVEVALRLALCLGEPAQLGLGATLCLGERVQLGLSALLRRPQLRQERLQPEQPWPGKGQLQPIAALRVLSQELHERSRSSRSKSAIVR